MSDLFKKLNILVQASINDVLEEAGKAISSPDDSQKRLSRIPLGKNIDDEVDYLRKQINKALDYEDELQARLQTLQTEIADYDRRADTALADGYEAQARYLLERMHMTKQRLTMTEADLNEHRIITQDLISRVNQLDATISEVRHNEALQTENVKKNTDITKPDEPDEKEASVSIPIKTKPSDENSASGSLQKAQVLSQHTGKVLADVLRETREKINQMGDLIEATEEVQSKSIATRQTEEFIAKDAVEQDIAQRLARLSAPPKPQKKDKADE